MADKSKIEWTDATWNPIRGCSIVSEGCRNCYAMTHAARFSGKDDKGNDLPYAGLAYRNESGAHWTGQVKLIEEHLEDPLRWKRPRLIFVNSMSDLFHESIPDKWIYHIFDIMYSAKQHIFQVLTKRPNRMLQCIANSVYLTNAPLSNIWLGVSVEDQKTADERIPLLLQTPAAVRWISAEPLLGPIVLRDGWLGREISAQRFPIGPPEQMFKSPLDWVVVGGESGAGARPMHPDWPRSLRDQCVNASVPFFFKQWGEWDGGGETNSECDDPCGRCVMAMRSWNGSSWRGSELTGTDWEAGSHLTGSLQIHRVGKHKAGRLLDHREWNDYPGIALGGA